MGLAINTNELMRNLLLGFCNKSRVGSFLTKFCPSSQRRSLQSCFSREHGLGVGRRHRMEYGEQRRHHDGERWRHHDGENRRRPAVEIANLRRIRQNCAENIHKRAKLGAMLAPGNICFNPEFSEALWVAPGLDTIRTFCSRQHFVCNLC